MPPTVILIAFDCDLTIDTSQGPVKIARLYELHKPPYIEVVIVSASPFCAQLPFSRYVSENTRLENLIAASKANPALLNIYVSDNTGDDIVARNARFAYIHPKDFI